MEDRVCCVCNVPVGQDARVLGGRIYCDAHYARAIRGRKALWISTAAAVLGLVLFTMLVEGLVALTRPALRGTPLILVGVVLALVPALLWMIVFYLQDRLEPEPKSYILGVFALGGVLALTVGIPVVRDLFHVQTWIGRAPGWAQLAGSILVVGFTQEYLKYAAVRFTVYPSAEFDERVDGIIYGVAAGLGLATVLTVQQLVASKGAQLNVAAIRATVMALSQATCGGVMGYFLGRRKFERLGRWWMVAGVSLAAVLNGLVTYLLGEVSVRGLAYTPLYGLILAAGVAVVVFAGLFVLMQRVVAATARA